MLICFHIFYDESVVKSSDFYDIFVEINFMFIAHEFNSRNHSNQVSD